MIGLRCERGASALASGCLLLALACGCGPKPKAQEPGPARTAASDASARKGVSVTIYNQDFGVVREQRTLRLGRGLVELEYRDVAEKLEPTTVHLRALANPAALAVREQNYRFDLLTPATLLEKHVGKKIRVYRYDEQRGTDEVKEAEVLSAEGGVVLRIDGQVTYDFPGRFAFPGVPAELVSRPTLVWLLESTVPEQDVEVSYVTRGLRWEADYVLTLDASDTRADLTGWVTLQNDSGVSFESASLKLVAGDVQRVERQAPPPKVRIGTGSMSVPQAPQFREEGLFEYHLYSLERPTTLANKEQKQVSLLEAHDLSVKKKLVLRGSDYLFRSKYDAGSNTQKVGVFVEFMNTKQNRLGIPLPKGTVRAYKADASGGLQFVGESAIDHTARDEELRIELGASFDVVAERRQLFYSSLFRCVSESGWEIRLRNHKDQAEAVEVLEPASGDWEVTRSTHAARRKDQKTFAFDVTVPARGEIVLNYQVRVRWC